MNKHILPDWLKQRNRAFHVTIRDVDCDNFDVQRFIDDLKDMRATFFSFFVGGYVTTYPTDLPYQRVSPWLNGRDLTGDIIETAHKANIKTLGMIDLGQIPENAAQDHPDWCAQNADGSLVERLPGLYASCPMGGYQNTYVRDIVAEILGRYDIDCVKFGGGSFGFPHGVCYCPSCRSGFHKATGYALPSHSDWHDPVWRAYIKWRLKEARQRVSTLGEVVHSIKPEMPFMGNSVAFGDPGWTVGASLDLEHQASVADAVQVEIQTRARWNEETGTAAWQWLSWPAETARYMTSVSDKPIWVVGSYFLAWPWRRSAMAPVEQKVYMAQVAANGADPMVNLSGGPPAVHEDPRGFQPVRELYSFLADHQAYYEGDTSGATVAIVYSHDTMFFYGQDDAQKRYVDSIRGIEQALHVKHIPFDIISTRVLTPEKLAQYKVLVLPNLACMDAATAQAIRSFQQQGGGIVATHETSLYDLEGLLHDDFLLADVLGASYLGSTRSSMLSDDAGYKQVYMDIREQHAVLSGLEGTQVLPLGSDICEVEANQKAAVPLTLSAPFVVFPEGFSYPTMDASGLAMAVLTETEEQGRVAYFPNRIDALYWHVRYPDHATLIANAVLWAAKTPMPVAVKAPSTLQVSLRTQPGRRLVHCINLSGGERMFSELIPLRDVEIALPKVDGQSIAKVHTLASRLRCAVVETDSHWRVTVPQIDDYEVVVFELA